MAGQGSAGVVGINQLRIEIGPFKLSLNQIRIPSFSIRRARLSSKITRACAVEA